MVVILVISELRKWRLEDCYGLAELVTPRQVIFVTKK